MDYISYFGEVAEDMVNHANGKLKYNVYYCMVNQLLPDGKENVLALFEQGDNPSKKVANEWVRDNVFNKEDAAIKIVVFRSNKTD